MPQVHRYAGHDTSPPCHAMHETDKLSPTLDYAWLGPLTPASMTEGYTPARRIKLGAIHTLQYYYYVDTWMRSNQMDMIHYSLLLSTDSNPINMASQLANLHSGSNALGRNEWKKSIRDACVGDCSVSSMLCRLRP